MSRVSRPLSDSSSPLWFGGSGALCKRLAVCLKHTHARRHTLPPATPGSLLLSCSPVPYRITAICQHGPSLSSIHPIVTTLSSAPVPLEASDLSCLFFIWTSLSFILALVSFCSSVFSYLIPHCSFFLILFSLRSLYRFLSLVSTKTSFCYIIWCSSVLFSMCSGQC